MLVPVAILTGEGVVESMSGAEQALATVIVAPSLSTDPAQFDTRTQNTLDCVNTPVLRFGLLVPSGWLVSPGLPRNQLNVKGAVPLTPTERLADAPDVIS